MKVVEVEKKSLAYNCGIKPGDNIISINNHKIEDILDYRFFSADEILNLKLKRNDREIEKVIEKEYDKNIGVVFEPMKIKRCCNKCIFCFIEQNPPGMRKEIYIKDEDYRLSFLYGNYITMSNLKEKELKKIVDLRLSPIYISVHALDVAIRKKLLGLKKDDRILEKIEYLAENKIEMHGQIVLCPCINDGKILKKTVFKLFEFYPYFNTVAVVPVGLTKHRRNLPKIRPVNKTLASCVMKDVLKWQKYFEKRTRKKFVYLSDEFYIQTGKEFPPYDDYDDFKQIENGVGLARYFINEIKCLEKNLPEKLEKKLNIGLVTGVLSENLIKKYFKAVLEKIKNVNVFVYLVKNRFFGESVKVSGLISGTDIYEAIKDENKIDIFILPPDCTNHNDRFIDDMSLYDLCSKIESIIMIYSKDNLLKFLRGWK